MPLFVRGQYDEERFEAGSSHCLSQCTVGLWQRHGHFVFWAFLEAHDRVSLSMASLYFVCEAHDLNLSFAAFIFEYDSLSPHTVATPMVAWTWDSEADAWW